jgi:endo-1,4-beta-D-glucanase Y
VDPASERALSEAMGHALILAVQFNDQQYFDQILAGLNNYFFNSNDLYCWEIQVDGHKLADQQYHISAAETEINVLMALLQATQLVRQHLWQPNNYTQLADQLEKNIWQHEVFSQSDYTLLLPSDEKRNPYWPIVYSQVNVKVAWAPTYFIPAYLKEFAKHYPEHDWTNLVNTGYILVNNILQKNSELLDNKLGIVSINPMPAWIWLVFTAHNAPLIENYFLEAIPTSTAYSNEYDSIRLPMYIGLDYFWDQDDRAAKFLQNFRQKAQINSPDQARIGASLILPAGIHNILAVSQYALAVPPVTAQRFQDYLQTQLQPVEGYFGQAVEKDYYYNQTFALYSYLLLNKRFIKVL